jgi:toxin YoeB
MKVVFEESALDDYNKWGQTDIKIFTKLAVLIKNTQREPFTGLGKPEPLKHGLSGYWARRINDEHRLVYKVENNMIFIKSCKGHYNDK